MYREMFFNPTLHTTRGVAMATVIDGLADGIRAAEADLGVDGTWSGPVAGATSVSP